MVPEQVERTELLLARDMDAAAYRAIASGFLAAYTSRCPGKETANEDGAVLIPCDPHRCVLAICDGFGGQPAGDQAARLALTTLAETVAQTQADGTELREGILNGFEQADHAVRGLGVGAATTMAVVEIDRGFVRTYHVGDSMILVSGQRGRVKLLTMAHSPVGYAQEAGMLEESEALHHEDRHVVSNMVGSAEMRIEIGPAIELSPRDTIVIASDGLFDNLRVEEIVETARKGPLVRAADTLADACMRRMREPQSGEPSKPDDLTIIVFRLHNTHR
jgi:serine/threonine protein phosphatase PrpC